LTTARRERFLFLARRIDILQATTSLLSLECRAFFLRCGSYWGVKIDNSSPVLRLGFHAFVPSFLCYVYLYRVIHKAHRDFRLLRYRSRDGHAEVDNVNRGRDTPNVFATLQVLDMTTLGDAADVSPVIKFLPHTLNHVA
jgi:hypothetical protein